MPVSMSESHKHDTEVVQQQEPPPQQAAAERAQLETNNKGAVTANRQTILTLSHSLEKLYLGTRGYGVVIAVAVAVISWILLLTGFRASHTKSIFSQLTVLRSQADSYLMTCDTSTCSPLNVSQNEDIPRLQAGMNVDSRLERLELDSVRIWQKLGKHEKYMERLEERVSALEEILFGRIEGGRSMDKTFLLERAKAFWLLLESRKEGIDALINTNGSIEGGEEHINDHQRSKFTDSNGLASLADKMKTIEAWIQSLQHATEKVSNTIDSELSSIAEDMESIQERIHLLENNVFVLEENTARTT